MDKANKIKYLLLALLIYIFIISPAKADSKDVLTVQSNKFMLNGEQVLLRGVAVGSPHERVLNFNRSSRADYQAIKNDWQANLVRLSIHPGVFLNDWVRGKNILEAEVAAARNQGLFVIIDWHVIGEPDGWYKKNLPDNKQYYSYNSDFTAAKEFWQYAADKYKGDRGVMFELWNEPVNQNNNLSWEKFRPYLIKLTELIRNSGSQNIIIAPGAWWTYDLRNIKNNPLPGANIAYAWHIYNSFNSHLSWDAALNDLDKMYPVIITEWGSNDDKDFGYSVKSGVNNYRYLESMKNLIISKGLSYTAWCWHATWMPNMFNNNWRELNDYGLLVKDFLNYPDKVKVRILQDEEKKKQLEINLFNEKIAKEQELILRVENFINYGADLNSIKLGKNERRSLVANFSLAYGHEPANESEWQDLMQISGGHWPYRKSQTAEAIAKENFKLIFRRLPNINNNSDLNAIRILAYGIRPPADKRSLKKEKTAIINFKKIFKRLPKSEQDWNFVRVMAYSGIK